MIAEVLDDGRKGVKWATDYFLKVHTATTEFYGQVGQGNVDHAYWGRPEDMKMPRPAHKIDTSKPGKLLSHKKENQQPPRHISSSPSFLPPSFRRHLKRSRDSKQFIFNLLRHSNKTFPCFFKGRIWPARQPPPSLQLPSCSRVSTPLIPTPCSHTPSSFSISPTIIAANTVTPSPTPGISTRKCSEISTQFAKCAALLHMSKRCQYLN